MGKVDFKKDLRAFYAPPAGRFTEVTVPPLSYVMVDGRGDPNNAGDYKRAVEALFGVSYAMKFAARNELGKDYVVPPLEGLWWAEDPGAFVRREKHNWQWTMMIMVPDFITDEIFRSAADKVRAKKGALPKSLRCASLNEGRCLQTLHLGSYDDEGPVLAELHDTLMPAGNLTFNGPHHEIYLSDPRRTDPSRLKTVLRQPVRPIGEASTKTIKERG